MRRHTRSDPARASFRLVKWLLAAACTIAFGIRFGVVVEAATLSVRVTATREGAAIAWTGGVGPFALQMKPQLSQVEWLTITSTTNRSLVVGPSGSKAYYRIKDLGNPNLTETEYDRQEDQLTPLAPATLNLLSEYGVSIRKPWQSPTGLDPEARWAIGTPDLKNHRFAQYDYDLANYLNETNTILLGKQIRDDYWSQYNPSAKSSAVERFAVVAGYHENLKPQGRVVATKAATNSLSQRIEILDVVGRFQTAFKVYRGIPPGTPKGIVLAIHGRSTGPDYVMGLGPAEDYTRSFGVHWLQHSYIVYAPQVDWVGGLPMDRLGYTPEGADLAKIFDLLEVINGAHSNNLPIVTAGISYGSLLAEFAGILSDQIKAVISIGGNGRGDYFVQLLADRATPTPRLSISAEKAAQFSSLPPDYYFHYAGIGLYKLLAPKPLVISIGSWDYGDDKYNHIMETLNYYKEIGAQGKILLNVFRGYHETDPEGEIAAFERIRL